MLGAVLSVNLRTLLVILLDSVVTFGRLSNLTFLTTSISSHNWDVWIPKGKSNARLGS
jgi:hypothetical protein